MQSESRPLLQKLFVLSFDQTTKQACLLRHNFADHSASAEASVVCKATFVHDSSNGSALLTNINHEAEPSSVLLLAELICEYVRKIKTPSKLFCVGMPFERLLKENKDFKTETFARLMIRGKPKSSSVFAIPPDVVTYEVSASSITSQICSEIADLLRNNSYWGDGVNEDYVREAIVHSTVFVASEKTTNKLVGVVRYISSGDLAYVSDMVVESKSRRRGIATGLMQEICRHIDEKGHSCTILVNASKGDGSIAGSPLYECKFGFRKYEELLRESIAPPMSVSFITLL